MEDSTTTEPTLVSVAESLGHLELLPLPAGATAEAMIGFIACRETDGTLGWTVRTSKSLHDEEVLGLLVGYVEHLKAEAASEWTDL